VPARASEADHWASILPAGDVRVQRLQPEPDLLLPTKFQRASREPGYTAVAYAPG
jgi:hypothetical protein